MPLTRTLAAVAVAAVFGCTENLARRPPELDGLRSAILKETRLEAEIRVKQTAGQVDLSQGVTIFFPFLPARADKVELERVSRTLVKQFLPAVKEIDVQFAANLGKKGLPDPRLR